MSDKNTVEINEDLKGKILTSLGGNYKDDLVFDISQKDEMLLYGTDTPENWHLPRTDEHIISYFNLGECIFNSYERLLHHGPVNIRSVLDFASGYGRCTRFLSQKYGSENVTSSDIDSDAVDFNIKSFGVKGFYSTKSPNDLKHDEKYDAIFVNSLFSHLASEYWEQWYKKLCSLLNPNGILIFSTHGESMLAETVFAGNMKDGFFYGKGNETQGRLEGDYYGVAFVSEEYVSNAIKQAECATLKGYYPRGLCSQSDGSGGSHDLYVVKK